MKDRTESILLPIASAIMIAVVVMCVITNLTLTNLNERLDKESERIKIIDEMFDTLDKKIDRKLDKPEPIEEINAEDLTLQKHNYPYRNEYQEERNND